MAFQFMLAVLRSQDGRIRPGDVRCGVLKPTERSPEHNSLQRTVTEGSQDFFSAVHPAGQLRQLLGWTELQAEPRSFE